jgi:predicted phosphodiesterase
MPMPSPVIIWAARFKCKREQLGVFTKVLPRSCGKFYATDAATGRTEANDNMRLQILSDVHLEFGDYEPEQPDVDAVILAGDIHVRRNAVKWIKKHFPDRPVIYVAGNHEFYGSTVSGLFSDLKAATESSNIAVLENESIQIGDFTFLGCTLWTDFQLWPNPQAAMLAAGKAMSDFNLIRSDKDWFQPEESVELHRESVRWLKDALGKCNPAKTVVVTHHAPSARSIPPYHAGSILNAAFASTLDEFVHQSRVPLWIHGHTHHSVDYQIGKTRIFSNQRGYPGQFDRGYRPEAVIELSASET